MCWLRWQTSAVVSLTIGINNTEHLNRVVARLSKVRDVLKVTRS